VLFIKLIEHQVRYKWVPAKVINHVIVVSNKSMVSIFT
jgi:hypothetical protein